MTVTDTQEMEWIMRGGEPHRMKTAKKVVADYLNSEQIEGIEFVLPADIYIVWFCKTLQNWKALLSTDVVMSGIYFEVTYNGDRNEIYLDHYIKAHNFAIKMLPVEG